HRLTTEAGVIDLNHIVNYPVKAVTVHRTTLKNDMIQLFQDPDTLGSLLMFTVIGFDGSAEKGEGVGVARDVLTSFWQVFVDSLAVVFVATCLFEEESLTNHDLLQSFRMYISDDERETFDKCCNGELSPDDEEVLELLSSYKCHCIPNAENIRLIFSELAHQELIQKPKYVVHCWAPHIQTLKSFPPFQSIEVLKEMYDEKRPSSRKVIKLLKCVPANDAENQCLDHLKRKDQCDTCISAKHGNIDEVSYEAHIKVKDEARAEKAKDTENAGLKKSVWTIDVRAVFLLPKIKASALYYKTKLQVHNLSFYNLKTKE
ncbi:Hypothetical predicted protein, partial [Paramuricea clavata]